jgi:beta-lactamase superfamily II metal-dependent hydrolase
MVDLGFPSQDILKRLTDAGCSIIRTDEVGATEVSVGGEEFQIRSFQKSLPSPGATLKKSD